MCQWCCAVNTLGCWTPLPFLIHQGPPLGFGRGVNRFTSLGRADRSRCRLVPCCSSAPVAAMGVVLRHPHQAFRRCPPRTAHPPPRDRSPRKRFRPRPWLKVKAFAWTWRSTSAIPTATPLTYEATSSDIEVATVSVSESVVSLTALNPGPAAISVSARDPGGGTATLSFAVTIGGFTVSGTVSDGRNRAPVLSGVPVWVGGSREEATLTGADGRYRLPNLWGTVSVSVAASGYVPRTVEIEVEADRTLDLVLEHTGEPPYGGTAYITPRMIEPSDPTALGSVTYAGRANRAVFDRRVRFLRNRQRFPVRGRVCR